MRYYLTPRHQVVALMVQQQTTGRAALLPFHNEPGQSWDAELEPGDENAARYLAEVRKRMPPQPQDGAAAAVLPSRVSAGSPHRQHGRLPERGGARAAAVAAAAAAPSPPPAAHAASGAPAVAWPPSVDAS